MKNFVFAALFLVSGTVAAVMVDGDQGKQTASPLKGHGLAVINKNLLGQSSMEVEYFGLNISENYTMTVSQSVCGNHSTGPSKQFSVKSNSIGVLNSTLQVENGAKSVRLSNGSTDVCLDAV